MIAGILVYENLASEVETKSVAGSMESIDTECQRFLNDIEGVFLDLTFDNIGGDSK